MGAALLFGVAGNGFVWLLSDPKITHARLWDDTSLQLRALKGSVSIEVSIASDSSSYDQYISRRRQISALHGADGWCSPERDDEGGAYLWGQANAGSLEDEQPLQCAGDDPHREATFDAYGYDA
eukprot:1530192-Prymnesium_polylepis.1